MILMVVGMIILMIGAMFLAATMRKEESPTVERIEHELDEREIIQLSTESFAVSIENELLHSQDLIVGCAPWRRNALAMPPATTQTY